MLVIRLLFFSHVIVNLYRDSHDSVPLKSVRCTCMNNEGDVCTVLYTRLI